jgi:hypothetical protein
MSQTVRGDFGISASAMEESAEISRARSEADHFEVSCRPGIGAARPNMNDGKVKPGRRG